MLKSFTGLLALLLAGAASAQTPDIVVRTSGPGPASRLLREVAATPHVLVREAPDGKAAIAKDTIIGMSVIVVGVNAAVEGRVEGDVVVVNGDLFMHPGGHITGRAIAIGGGVYASSLAEIEGEALQFYDTRYDVHERNGQLQLDYRAPREIGVPTVSFPLVYGVRIPSYDRVQGLSVPIGPRFTFDTGRFVIDPLVTYRSDLGAWDPSLAVDLGVGRTVRLLAWGGRGTFTNDAWIQSDIMNSVSTIVAGRDRRNYFRADRAELALRKRWQRESAEYEATVGGRGEFATSVSAGGPWSLLNRDDSTEGIPRPNPAIARGRTYSALASVGGRWTLEPEATARLLAGVEVPFRAPLGTDWVQLTVEGTIRFPTFGVQSFELESHAVLTSGDDAPPQRYAYLGGSGTLPTFDLLEFGGDQLLYFDARYNVPITAVQLPFVGPPVVSLRYMIGSAGVGSLPGFEQNLGLRLAVQPIRVDFTVDPSSGDTHFGFGLVMMR
jgi:hypothetical protein